MSWEAYIDLLKRSSNAGVESPVKEAGIYGHDGSTWAHSEGMVDPTLEEIKVLTGPEAPMHQNGPKVGGLKCMLVRDGREDSESLSLILKVRGGPDNGKNICVGKTEKAIIVAVGEPNGPSLVPKVHDVAKHLKHAGY